MTLTTVGIDPDFLERLAVVSKFRKRSQTQQIHQFIEDEEKKIKQEKKENKIK